VLGSVKRCANFMLPPFNYSRTRLAVSPITKICTAT
jgi:hypothetical protein